jgi:hypothetical protein
MSRGLPRRDAHCRAFRGRPAAVANRRPLPFAWEVVTQAAPKSRNARCSTVPRALCRTRTGDPFLTMAVRLVSRRRAGSESACRRTQTALRRHRQRRAAFGTLRYPLGTRTDLAGARCRPHCFVIAEGQDLSASAPLGASAPAAQVRDVTVMPDASAFIADTGPGGARAIGLRSGLRGAVRVPPSGVPDEPADARLVDRLEPGCARALAWAPTDVSVPRRRNIPPGAEG